MNFEYPLYSTSDAVVFSISNLTGRSITGSLEVKIIPVDIELPTLSLLSTPIHLNAGGVVSLGEGP